MNYSAKLRTKTMIAVKPAVAYLAIVIFITTTFPPFQCPPPKFDTISAHTPNPINPISSADRIKATT
jgi:hypothetical protein